MLDGLTLDQLRIFVAVAETGSFSAAARRLGRVHSAVSQAVASLEDQLGTRLFDRTGRTPRPTEAAGVLLADARRVLAETMALKARATALADGTEPELTVAVDVLFPGPVLAAALTALREAFPQLSVSLFTEGLGGSEQRLRDGAARLAVYPLRVTGATDLASEYLTDVVMVPVVAAGHPLAAEPGPIANERLEPHTQLVLTDRTPLTHNSSGGILAPHVWRFADMATRLDYLLDGFGWCNMPRHTVEPLIAQGRLVHLELASQGSFSMQIDAVWEKGRTPGRAGRWLLDDLRARLTGI